MISYNRAARRLAAYCLAGAALLCSAASATPVQTIVLNDFEGAAPTMDRVRTTNSSASGDSFTNAPTITTESGSKRLLMVDPGGGVNGIVVTLPAAFTEPGFYLITADIKVGSSATTPINTFGMAAKVGGPSTTRVLDGNAGYVLNLSTNPTNGAALGYQTIGAGINVDSSGSFPKDLTLYFSTDPSGTPSDGHADFSGSHRGSALSLSNANTNPIYIDNIKRIGPGNFGEERHAWISVSSNDGLTNLTTLENNIMAAFNNGFNCVDVLVRYRANRYYNNNRDFSTYPNPEPYISGASDGNDPIQYAIDRCHELGMRVYGSFSCFLVAEGANPYPGFMPSGGITYTYNGGSPTPDTSAGGLWADPGRADVRNYTLNVAKDLVQNYDLDGIIFDRIRYETQDYGYNPQALTEMGISGTPAPTNANFMQKRREAITTFLNDAYEQLTAIKPWLIVGTVPIAYGTGFNETYNYVFQSWPQWSAQPTANRTVSFGTQDLIQPQFYRMWDSGGTNTAPGANRTLMQKALYGDTASDPMDFGLMPGANTNVAPLFYAEAISNETDAASTANAMAANFCDAQSPAYYMNGFGSYSAYPTFTPIVGPSVIARIRANNTTPCGEDIMMPTPPLPDFLMKQGWDNTPPNAAAPTFTVNPGVVQLNWATPAPAADGETPSRYLVYRSTASTAKPYYANQLSRTVNITGNSFSDTPPSGTYYYRVVAVDDYNNKATSTVVGPVVVTSANVIVESRLSGGTLNTARYSESPAMLDTASKSTAAGLTGTGSRYSTNLSQLATFTPNLPTSGLYNVYITVGGGSNTNNLAKADYTINNAGSPISGQVNLYYNDATVGNAWKLLASNVPFAAGTTGNIVLDNVDGDGANPQPGNRFVMDAVKFEFTSTAVQDWQLY